MQEQNKKRTKLAIELGELGISQKALLQRMNDILNRDIQVAALSLYPGKSDERKKLREKYIHEHTTKVARGNYGINAVVGVTRVTLYNVIHGKNKNGVSSKTAYLLLEAINQIRAERGLYKLTLDDIGISIFKRWK